MQNKIKKFALIGYPLGHSLSPIIHKELLKITSVNGEYNLIEVKESNLESIFANKLKNLNGFNITIPHKINIIPFLDELSEKAKLYGSVNTVVNTNGKMIGYNTDCIGFLKGLELANINLEGKVLICGSGGVSKMFAFESILANANVTLAVRESGIKSANLLKDELKEKLGKDCKVQLLSEVNEEYDLIINGTPVGMYPNINACPLNESVIKLSKSIFDAIYNPLDTKLISIAKQYGIKYSNGLSMLIWQAVASEEIWNNVHFSNEDVKQVFELVVKSEM